MEVIECMSCFSIIAIHVETILLKLYYLCQYFCNMHVLYCNLKHVYCMNIKIEIGALSHLEAGELNICKKYKIYLELKYNDAVFFSQHL